MTKKEFNYIVNELGLHSPAVAGCKLVLVDGMSINAAARKIGMHTSNVSRMLKKIPDDWCQTCKQPRKDLLEK